MDLDSGICVRLPAEEELGSEGFEDVTLEKCGLSRDDDAVQVTCPVTFGVPTVKSTSVATTRALALVRSARLYAQTELFIQNYLTIHISIVFLIFQFNLS